jgi:hypothetical protein
MGGKAHRSKEQLGLHPRTFRDLSGRQLRFQDDRNERPNRLMASTQFEQLTSTIIKMLPLRRKRRSEFVKGSD